MSIIKTLIEEKEPFAIVQYFVTMHLVSHEQVKEYELIKISNRHLKYIKLSKKDIDYFKSIYTTLSHVKNEVSGNVYEFLDFRKVVSDSGIALNKTNLNQEK